MSCFYIQFTLEQHGFEMCRPTYMQIFSTNKLEKFWRFEQFEIRIHFTVHITYKTCVNQRFMLLVRLLVNSRLLVVKFWGSQMSYINFQLPGDSGPLTSVLTATVFKFCSCDSTTEQKKQQLL